MDNTTCNDLFSTYPQVLNAKMVAEIMDIGYVKALNLIKYGGIKFIKIGNVYRVPKKSFLEWLYIEESKVIDLEN